MSDQDKQTKDPDQSQSVEERMAALETSLTTIAGAVEQLADQRTDELAEDADLQKIREERIRKAQKTKLEERARCREIERMCGEWEGLEDLAESLIDKGTPLDEARAAVIARLAILKDATDGSGFRVAVTEDERDKVRQAITDGLELREGLITRENCKYGTEFAVRTIREVASECLRYAGVPIPSEPHEIFQRALSTSDFPNILANVANKAVLVGFEREENTYEVWADTSGVVTDYRSKELSRASEAPDLLEVDPDGGEFKLGKMTDKKEAVAVTDYGRIIPFTRAAMINDDLGELTDALSKLGESASRKYSDLVYGVLTTNGNMGDGTALFHADHGNLAAGGDVGAPSIATLGAAEAAMGIQKDIQSLQYLNIRPKYIAGPWKLKSTIDGLTADVTFPTKASEVNLYSFLVPVYEARLDANSTTAWYLMGPKGKTVKLFTLNGQKTPVLESKAGWEIDGMQYKARISAKAIAVDWVAAYKNAGA